MQRKCLIFTGLIILCIVSSCTIESTKIVTDFDYVKLTQSSNPLSTYYVKGMVRGMPFSYSTNDTYYTNTTFADTITKIFDGRKNTQLSFNVGNLVGYIPVWFQIESLTMTMHEFVTNMYVNQIFSIGPPLGIGPGGFPDELFHAWLQVDYYNQYGQFGQQLRAFTCCAPSNPGTLIVTNIQYFDTYVNVTLEFKGPMYSAPPGDVLYFGDADIEMCIRINLN